MAQQTINVGTTANDGTGDNLRNAFIKTNDNFTEVYSSKEDKSNKSTSTSLGTSNTLYPTQNAVKNYVDTQVATKIGGSGTDNYIPRFNGTNALENSIIFDNGTNVGIGTSSPIVKFQVGNGTNLQQSYISGGGYDLVLGAAGGNFLGFATQTISTIFNTSSTPLGIATNGSKPLIFGTQAIERMRITSSGNVGIGTSTPNNTLEVNGTFLASNSQNSISMSTTYINIYSSGTLYATTGIDLGDGFGRIGVNPGGDLKGVEFSYSDGVWFRNVANSKFGMMPSDASMFVSADMVNSYSPSDTTTIVKWVKFYDKDNSVDYYMPLYQ